MAAIKLNTVKTNSTVLKSVRVKNVTKSAVVEPAKQSLHQITRGAGAQTMDRDTREGYRETEKYARPIMDISKASSSQALYKTQMHVLKNYIDRHAEEIQSTLVKNGIYFEGELKSSTSSVSLPEIQKLSSSFKFSKIYNTNAKNVTAKTTTAAENIKVVALGAYAKSAQKLEYKKDAGIKALPKSVARIATSEFLDSEAQQGMNIAEGLFIPVKTAHSFNKRITDRVYYHTKKSILEKKTKAAHIKNGLTEKAAEEATKSYVKNQMGGYSNNYFMRDIKKRIYQKIDPVKQAAKKKAVKTLQNVSKKAAEKAAQESAKIVSREVAKKVAEASAKLAEMIGKGASSFGWYGLVIALILIATIIVAWAIVFTAEAAINVTTLMSMATISSPYVITESQDLDIMTGELRNLHEAELALLREYAENYEVADIQCRNGTKENYRELISASFVEIYEAEDYNDEDVKHIISSLYNQTHKITVDEYTYLEADGTEKSAAHIYLDILREDTMCYSALQGVTFTNGTGSLCPAGTCVNNDWMDVVKIVKTLIAQTGAGYSQSGYVSINVNGETRSVRTDCSGYVSACLKIYGNIINEDWSSSGFVNAPNLPGFTRYDWSGWENLQEGDIIARYRYNSENPEASGHVEIFAYNLNGMHYVYSNGSDSGVANAGVSTDGRGDYMVVWRPNASVTETEEEEETEEELQQDPNIAAFSNTKNLKMDEDGNEEGYEVALKSTIVALTENPNSKFTNAYYDSGRGAHLSEVEASGSMIMESPLDFIRVVYAQHGVNIGYEMHTLVLGGKDITYRSATPGDIIIYRPDYDESELPKMTDLIKQYKESLTTSKPDEFVTDIGEVGQTEDTEPIKDKFTLYVPMIYLGDDMAVAFCKDLTADIADYPSTEAAVRTYNLKDDLDKKKIARIIKTDGFTVNRVYGATNSFSGWTNLNISAMQTFYRSDFWENNQYTMVDENGHSQEMYFITGYREDYFTGNDVSVSGQHFDQFVNDLRPYAILAYENTNVLPSVLIGEAYYRSSGRSTEESLTYNNIYETTAVAGAVVDIDKYYYAETGDVTTTTVAYYKYASLQDALTEHYEDINSHCTVTSAASNYSAVIDAISASGYYSAEDAQQIKNTVESLDILDYDDIAKTRRQHILSAESEISILTRAIENYGATTGVTQQMYESMQSYISHASDIINSLNEYMESVGLWSDRANRAYEDLKALRDRALEISEIQRSLLAETEQEEEPEEEEPEENNNPASPVLDDVRIAPSGAIIVEWTSPNAYGIRTNSFEIQFSTSESFTGRTTKTRTISNPAAVMGSLPVSDVQRNTTYYIRYRYRYNNNSSVSGWSQVYQIETQ